MHTYVLPILKIKDGIATIKGDVVDVLAGHTCVLRRKDRYFIANGLHILFSLYVPSTDHTLVGLPSGILKQHRWTHITISSWVYHPLAHTLSAKFTDPSWIVKLWRWTFRF